MFEIVIVVISGVGGGLVDDLILELGQSPGRPWCQGSLILAQVVHHYFNGAPFYDVKYKNVCGHAIHLLVGVFFAFCYSWLWGIGGFTWEDI